MVSSLSESHLDCRETIIPFTAHAARRTWAERKGAFPQTKLNRHMAAIAAAATLQIARRKERVDYILLLAQWARQWQSTPNGSVEIGHLTLLGYIVEFAQPRTLLTLQRVFPHVDLGEPQSWPAPNSDANDH